MEKVLEVKDLCKTYVVNKRQINVLKNMNFFIEKGEMVAVMGPSGSGKSTLLYTASGMDKMTAGSVYFAGTDIRGLSARALAALRLDEMGFVFQQMYMLKNLTVFDNIVLPAFQSRKNTASKKEKIEKGEALMKKMGIIEIADNDIEEASGGQLQRACICRSLINNPQMVFADEPTGALNRSASEEVMEQFVQINQEGTTIMLVTHDIRVAAKCSRVMYLVDGTLKGECRLGKCEKADGTRERERTLTSWLTELGW